MSAVKTGYNLEDIQTEFDSLLKNLNEILKEVRPRVNILNTKLGKIKRDLLNINSLDNDTLAKLVEIVVKYNSINNLFIHNITYNKNDLAKIIEGNSDYSQDSNESYNDYFFELSMGIRFLLAFRESNPKINLDGICDIVINDSIAVECKYIHSSSNLIKNIQKAKKQIEKRVADNQAEFGFIALDLSHICPRDRVQEFADYTLKKFIENYEILESKGYIKGNLLEKILSDNNFYNIISNYTMLEVETSLYSELGFSYDMGANTVAIIFQSMNAFVFEYKGSVKPITTRGMIYFLNTNLNHNHSLKIKELIHSLAVGV